MNLRRYYIVCPIGRCILDCNGYGLMWFRSELTIELNTLSNNIENTKITYHFYLIELKNKQKRVLLQFLVLSIIEKYYFLREAISKTTEPDRVNLFITASNFKILLCGRHGLARFDLTLRYVMWYYVITTARLEIISSHNHN